MWVGRSLPLSIIQSKICQKANTPHLVHYPIIGIYTEKASPVKAMTKISYNGKLCMGSKNECVHALMN